MRTLRIWPGSRLAALPLLLAASCLEAPDAAADMLGGSPYGVLANNEFRDAFGNDPIYFEPGITDLTEESKGRLNRLAGLVSRRGWSYVYFLIQGYACEEISDDDARSLGEKRTRAVYSHLVSQGVKPGNLRLRSRGWPLSWTPFAKENCRVDVDLDRP
ncbi:hypothetical protein CU669_19160 [Paramagnetospirillum kuznetsovii]|uniref:OmpA-like domain-containing protein n=1 Tax=Paramagnetospirillum kuznetsovii TaxID=2053833 RepID=A0A364NTT9_9PROT|nr:OmpA family protein [Paramagnetospirillum kuznetsovii]RAU20287.1 hypothetical protein CU669_19160 [Paramagnetospirillum kuznetsovii]